MTRIIVLGAGGHAREILAILDEMSRAGDGWQIVGLTDDDPTRAGALVDGHIVLGDLDWLQRNVAGLAAAERPVAVCAVGNPPARRKVALSAAAIGLAFVSVVSPRASVAASAMLRPGCVVFPGAVIGPGVVVGEHAVVNAGATVSHESVLGDYATLAPGVHLAGNTTIGQGCEVGIGAVTVQGVRLGAWSVIGAGTVVIRDLPSNVTAVGSPARITKTREERWHER